MRHGDEQAQVAEWLYGLLTGDQALADALGWPLPQMPEQVWPDVAPPGTDPQWVVYSVGEARDVQPVGPFPRLVTVVPVNVRVVSRSSDPGTSSAAARRLYALLHGNLNVPVSDGGIILTSMREQALNYPEELGGIQYRHTGGLYRVQVN